MRWIGLVAVSLLAWVTGCQQPTQLLVVVDSDLEPGVEISAVNVTAASVGAAGDTARFELSEVALPFSLGVSSAHGGDDEIHVLVQALGPDDGPVISYLAVTRFLPGEIRRLPVPLARACLSVECGPERVCRGGECVEPAVDPASLPSGSGSNPPSPLFEGPRVAPDGGVEDASTCEPGAPCDLGECARAVMDCGGATAHCVLEEPVELGTPCGVDGTCDGTGRCEQ